MQAMSSLDLTLMYLLAAVIGVVVCRSLQAAADARLPVGRGADRPHALALAQNSEGIRHLGEFGVVFLMFVDRAGVQPAQAAGDAPRTCSASGCCRWC